MPKRVLHLLGSAQLEGTSIARIVAALAKFLDHERYSIHAWFLGMDGPLVGELQAAGVQVSLIPWKEGIWEPRGAWRFWNELKRGQYSIVHQHWGGRSVRWLAKQTSHCPLIVHLHGRLLKERGAFLLPGAVGGADEIIAVSRAVAAQVTGKRARVIYPGTSFTGGRVDQPNSASNETTIIVGTAGRLAPMKGLVDLVRALAALRERFPDVRLEIAGTGSDRNAIQAEIERLGLRDVVEFLGWQPELGNVLTKWDVFVQPSLNEGFGVSTLEAMAAGLPVVATAVGGTPELIQDGRTGWLVPPRDPPAIAARLQELILDPARRRTMGAAGRTRAREQFSTARMVAEVSEVYDELISGSPNPLH